MPMLSGSSVLPSRNPLFPSLRRGDFLFVVYKQARGGFTLLTKNEKSLAFFMDV